MGAGATEIPLLPSFLLTQLSGRMHGVRILVLSGAVVCSRSTLRTVSGGEFDWGGTSVKR